MHALRHEPNFLLHWSDRRALAEWIDVGRARSRLHHLLFTRWKAASLAASICAYTAIVLCFGRELAISNNYFVALPVLVAALGYSVPGGLAAGLLGLPANLLLFAILGHPEYSPANKLIAECFGTVLGFSLGYVAHNFRMYEGELRRRFETERDLTRALKEKDILLKELNHRVKNNLAVIKSIAQLQRSRSRDPDFLVSIDRLVERIHAIALVHEQLYGPEEGVLTVDPGHYLDALVRKSGRQLLGHGRRVDSFRPRRQAPAAGPKRRRPWGSSSTRRSTIR